MARLGETSMRQEQNLCSRAIRLAATAVLLFAFLVALFAGSGLFHTGAALADSASDEARGGNTVLAASGGEGVAAENDLWEYDLFDDKVVLTAFKKKGSMKAVVIPADIDGRDVMTLAGGLFAGDTYLESVTFQCTSLTDMGEDVFAGCTGLKSVSLTAVEELSELGGFKGCTSLESVTIPACVQTLARSAFEGCGSLATVGYQDPSSLAEIGAHAFDGCASLSSFEMPVGMNSIGNSAFAGCSSLASVDFKGAGLEEIDVRAFSGCSALKTFHFPSGVQIVGELAFEGCTVLTTVSFGKQLPDTFGGVFKPVFVDCPALEMMIFPKEVDFYDHDRLGWKPGMAWLGIQYNDDGTAILDSINTSSAHTSITLPAKVGNSTVIAIQLGAAGEDELLTEVIFPEDTQISKIDQYAFKNCTSLKSIVIPASVTEIGSGAFKGCSGLRSVEFNTTSLTMLQGGTFYDCHALKEIRLPEGMTTLTGNDFYNCTSLESVYLPDTLTTIGPGTFGSFGHSQLMSIKTMRMPDSNVEMAIPNDNEFMGTWKHKGSVVFEVTYGSWADYVWFQQHLDNQVFEERNRRYIPVDIARTDGSVDLQISYPDNTYNRALKLPTLTGTRWYKTIYQFEPITGAVADCAVAAAEGYDCVSVGQQKAVIWGQKPHFTGSRTVEFEISPKDVFFAEVSGLEPVTWDDEDWELDDWDPRPTFSVMFDDIKYNLDADKDYTVSYGNNRFPGEATITLKGQGNFDGTKDFHFTIEKISLAKDEDVEVSAIPDQHYTGAQVKPVPAKVRAKDRHGKYTDDLELFEGPDYTLSYGANVNVGQGSVTLTGTGDYVKDSKTVTFNIVSGKMGDATIAAVPDQEYTGAAIEPALEVSLDGGADELVEGRDYKVTWSGNVNAGTARGTVTGVAPYCTGTRTVEFSITPKPATIAVDDASKARGEADPAFTGTVEGLVRAGDLGEVRYIRTNDDEAVGTYKGVLDATYTANPNYDVSVAKGDFTITKPNYSVSFDANVPASASTTCSGSMDDERFAYDEEKALSANGYALPGYDFTGWNTKADGTGTAYADKADVQNLSNNGETVTLYAQWNAKSYEIVFDPGEIGGDVHWQTARFDQPGRLKTYSDAAFGWNSGGRKLHGWAGTGFGSFYGDGAGFVNLCGEPRPDGSLADRELVAQWVEGGQIIVTVTKDGAPQGGLADELSLVDGSGTEFSVHISYENGKYTFDPSQASSPGVGQAQLPPGDYNLSFDAPGYPKATARIVYGEASAASAVFAYHTVTYEVVHGTWADGTTADKKELVLSGEHPACVPTNMIAEEGFTCGAWDVEPGSAVIVNAVAFTYAFEAEQEVLGTVRWADNGNELGLRPERVTVRLLANGEEAGSTEVTAGSFGLWAFGFDKLPPRDPQGNEISYSVAADEVPDYTLGVEHRGDNAYLITYATKPLLTITPVSRTLTYNGQIQGPGDVAYEDPAEIAEAVEVEGLREGDALASVVLDGQGKDAGDYGLVASGASVVDAAGATVTDDYIVDYAPGTLTIEPAKATVATGSASRAYDGEPLASVEASIEGLVGGETATVTATGSRTDAGSSPNTYSIEWGTADEGNYDVAENLGTLAVTPAKAAIRVDGASKVAGEADPAFTGTVEGLVRPGDLGEVRYVRTNGDEEPGTYAGVLDAEYTANPNYDVTVAKGDFTIKELYTLRWLDGDGSLLQEKTYVDGEPAPAYDGKEPAKAATAQYTYAFAGWDGGTAVGSTTTYRPLFSETLNEYAVRFVDDDGAELQSGQVAYGETPEYRGKEPEKPATAQYTYSFAGWTPKVAPVTDDATYRATYDETLNEYTVTFVNWDGTVLQSSEVPYGEEAEYRGEEPTRPATAQYTYSFKGWSPKVAPVTGDATYEATYDEALNEYEVTFVDYDGETVLKEAAAYAYGTPAADVERPADPTREPDAEYTYTFSGWTPEVAGVTADAVYTAVYESGKRSYTVTWLQDDGSPIDRTTVEYGEKPAHADPSKPATAQYTYAFAGWSPEVVPVTGDAAYTATYTEAVNEYTVRFVNDDGTELQAGRVAYGEAPEYKGATPEKPATAQYTYAFKGWSPEVVPVTGDATYTATYTETPKKGTLTFDLAGGTIDGKTSLTIEADVGDVITIPKAPVRDGYTFKYWRGSEYHPGDKYTVEGDHAFTAVWEKNANGGGDGGGGSVTKGSPPNTGDTVGGMVAVLAIATACALCAIALAVRRRRGRMPAIADHQGKRCR